MDTKQWLATRGWILILTLSLCSCTDDDAAKILLEAGFGPFDGSSETPAPYDGDLDVYWQRPLADLNDQGDTSSVMDVRLYAADSPHRLVMVKPHPETYSRKDILAWVNTFNGYATWEQWRDEDVQSELYNDGGLLIYNSIGEIVALEELTGNMVWEYPMPAGGRADNFKVENGTAYAVFSSNTSWRAWERHLVRSTANSGMAWDTLYSKVLVDGHYPRIYPPSSFTDDAGHQILVFSTSTYRYTDYVSKSGLVVYNSTTDEIIWETDSLGEGIYASRQNLQLHQGNIMIATENGIAAMDALTSNIVWENSHHGRQYAKLVVGNTAIFGEGNTLVAVDAETGNTLWHKTGDFDFHNGFVPNDGRLYHVDGKGGLMAISLQNGNTVWHESEENYTGTEWLKFDGQFVIIEEQDLLVAHNGYYLMGIRL